MALFVFLLMLYVSQSAAVTVKAYKGDESVSLPFFMRPLKNDSSALWTRGERTPDTVHIRDKDEDDLDKQSPQFKGRTEMKPYALQTGDLSLVLKKPTASDSGTYTCLVKEGATDVALTRGELIVISVNVTAVEGVEFVSLPCTMTPLDISKDPSVRWTREGSDQVHFRLKEKDSKEKDDLRTQSPQFRGRTQMNPDALQTGDLSLVLKKLTLKDSGTYTCMAREDRNETGRIVVKLYSVEVKIEPQTDPWPIIGAVVVTVVLVGLLVLGGVWYYRKRWMRSKVLVCEGAESVALPFYMRSLDMKKDPSALWTLEGSSPDTVHLRVMEGDDLSRQRAFVGVKEPCLPRRCLGGRGSLTLINAQSDHFKGRTEMMPDSLETGYLSLVLKKPTASDSGTYTCVVKEGTTKVGCISVKLIVIRSTGVTLKVCEGDESVSLPFFMSDLDINKDPSALWTREGSSPDTVHLRVMEGDDLSRQSDHFKGRTEMKPDALQTGDLSLVLKNAKASDRGTYTCVVKEGTTDVKCTTVELMVKKKWKYGKRPQWNKKKHNASSVI